MRRFICRLYSFVRHYLTIEIILSVLQTVTLNVRTLSFCLSSAISTHGGKCLELLLQEGAQVNAMALDGRTPLHLTAIHGRHARAEPLLDHGASIDAVDKDANTPLHIASLNGHELLIRTLLSHKAEASVSHLGMIVV